VRVSPCKGCTDRHEACHDRCELYQAWRADKIRENNALRDSCPNTERRIGERRSKAEYNRTGVWKKT
jgi:hypothetical protein